MQTGGFIKNAVLSALLSAISRLKGQGQQPRTTATTDTHGANSHTHAGMENNAGSSNSSSSSGGSNTVDIGIDIDSEEPVLCQADLLKGCKLQMRGSLSGVSAAMAVAADSRFAAAPQCGVDELFLARAVRDGALSVVRFEKARARVYGSWVTPAPVHMPMPMPMPTQAVTAAAPSSQDGTTTSNTDRKTTSTTATNTNTTTTTTTSSSHSTSHSHSHGQSAIGSLGLAQKGTICCMCGPAGSGKRTLAGAIAADLGRQVKSLHVSDILASRTGTGTDLATLEAVVRDARLSDAVVVVDGFEHVVAEEGQGAEGGKLHLMLARILDVLHSFPGVAVLLCHLDNPQNLTLQRDFAARLYCLLRFSAQQTPHEVRARQWRALMPAAAPLEGISDGSSGRGSSSAGGGSSSAGVAGGGGGATGVNFAELGRRFELTPGCIQAAIARACAEAAMRADSDEDERRGPGSGSGWGSGGGSGSGGGGDRGRVGGLGVVRQKDLVAAGEAEVSKLKGDGMSFDMMSKLFT